MSRLKFYRKKSGLTQAEVARMLNVHQSAVSNWERGQLPAKKYRPQLRALFRATEEELFGEETENEKTDPGRAAGRGDPA